MSQAREIAPKGPGLGPVAGHQDTVAQPVLLREVDAPPERKACPPRPFDLPLLAASHGDLHERLRLAHVREESEVEEAERRSEAGALVTGDGAEPMAQRPLTSGARLQPRRTIHSKVVAVCHETSEVGAGLRGHLRSGWVRRVDDMRTIADGKDPGRAENARPLVDGESATCLVGMLGLRWSDARRGVLDKIERPDAGSPQREAVAYGGAIGEEDTVRIDFLDARTEAHVDGDALIVGGQLVKGGVLWDGG